jgi:plasmid maintenance system antidote protein VapI
MVGKDIIEMRIKELKRLKIIHEAIEKHITQKTAASIIGVTERHVRRIILCLDKCPSEMSIWN